MMTPDQENAYIAGQSRALLDIAYNALANVTVNDNGESMLRAEACRAIDALRHRIVNRYDEEQS